MDYVIAGVFVVSFVIVLYFCVREYMEAFRAQQDAERGQENTHELADIYHEIWNGDPADESAAWFRVIGHLERNGYPDEMLTEARLHLMFSDRRDNRSSFMVNSNGRLIRVDQRGGKDDDKVRV